MDMIFIYRLWVIKKSILLLSFVRVFLLLDIISLSGDFKKGGYIIMHDNLRCVPYIKNYNDKFFKLIVLKGELGKGGRRFSGKGTVNEEKLENNLIRSKSKVFELSLCNDWDYFVTLTLDSKKYDRYNLKKYIKDLSQFIRDQRKSKESDIKYLLIPEQHKDGAWHLHGFMKGIPALDIVSNGNFDKSGNPYVHWLPYFKKFGFMSMGEIQDDIGASFYIRKYISKTMLQNNFELGLHSYYSSNGLKGADELEAVVCGNVSEFEFKYTSDFVDVYNLDYWQAQELILRTMSYEAH